MNTNKGRAGWAVLFLLVLMGLIWSLLEWKFSYIYIYLILFGILLVIDKPALRLGTFFGELIDNHEKRLKIIEGGERSSVDGEHISWPQLRRAIKYELYIVINAADLSTVYTVGEFVDYIRMRLEKANKEADEDEIYEKLISIFEDTFNLDTENIDRDSEFIIRK